MAVFTYLYGKVCLFVTWLKGVVKEEPEEIIFCFNNRKMVCKKDIPGEDIHGVSSSKFPMIRGGDTATASLVEEPNGFRFFVRAWPDKWFNGVDYITKERYKISSSEWNSNKYPDVKKIVDKYWREMTPEEVSTYSKEDEMARLTVAQKKRSAAAVKAAATRKANALFAKRSAAAHQAWATRRGE